MTESDITCDESGAALIVAAKNPFTNVLEAFCFAAHEEFNEWSAGYKREGYELVTLTIGEVLADIDASHSKMH